MHFILITGNVQFKAKYSKKSASSCYGSYLRKMVNSSIQFFFLLKIEYFPNTDKHSREHLSWWYRRRKIRRRRNGTVNNKTKKTIKHASWLKFITTVTLDLSWKKKKKREKNSTIGYMKPVSYFLSRREWLDITAEANLLLVVAFLTWIQFPFHNSKGTVFLSNNRP